MSVSELSVPGSCAKAKNKIAINPSVLNARNTAKTVWGSMAFSVLVVHLLRGEGRPGPFSLLIR
jgi:hypothetical protein